MQLCADCNYNSNSGFFVFFFHRKQFNKPPGMCRNTITSLLDIGTAI